jgi:poly(A) polymerase
LWLRSVHELVDPVPLLPAPAVAALLGLEEGPELGAAMRTLIEAQVWGKVRTADGARRWLKRNVER